ncbi:hypothetical protein TTHERM_00327180 (macronuclear) [Tetrahymena thermophila SB210]|uniref:Uncharacterized protein n=1 Tax=Tetrahymena thermophila (strain SB210) TaxID=312017 RepID=I7LXU9_TETTS|nr:hypothetical protein TTHERM_00327180 [Tetrahymena thermophila SB210]EAS06236.1 hypothetical protein TTHERM_00327180 [Tetrahymena thermophila SB210]|eukprot:XP_001026481.1 hypothetical protein TTHERM_00327180 [Tetrahymena thermophila SB210]
MESFFQTQLIDLKQNQSFGVSQRIKKLYQNSKTIKNDTQKPKRKYQKKRNLVVVPLDNYYLQLCRIQKLDNITYVCNDGILRFIPSIGQISFNYLLQQAEKIEENSNLNVVSIVYKKQNLIQIDSLEKIMDSICNIQGITREEILNLLYDYSNLINDNLQANSDELNEQFYSKLDENFTEFQQKCTSFLTQYQISNPSSLYFYSIARLNLESKMYETAQIGYSKGYLDLLGLDVSSIQQIYLRNKKIDLVKNQQDICMQALRGLSNVTGRDKMLIYENYESFITTFDGFLLKIYQRKVNMCNKVKPIIYHKHQFNLTLIEIEVDFQSFQDLLEYRKRLSQSSENQKFDDFIRRENSYLFEDVEYSIQSQQFIDKFYSQNVQDLELIKQHLIQKEKQCCYRIIKN